MKLVTLLRSWAAVEVTLSKIKFPFGDPDGSRADLSDLMHTFVGFGSHVEWGGIATNPDDRSIRVIVGKKGAGKTVYLRRLQDSTMVEDGVFSQKIQSDIPMTSQVLEFCEICQGEQVTEKWRDLWRVSILTSLLTLFLFKSYFSEYIVHKKREEMKKRFREILPSVDTEHSAYDVIKDFISRITTQAEYNRFIRKSLWVELRLKISELLKTSPPVFYYLDALDDEFSHAPMEWLQCHKGLFYAVMRMLREQGALGSRLHVTIGIRDIVFASVLRSEHAGKYRGAPHVCKLNWDTDRIAYFFSQKIEQLDDEYFDRPNDEKSLENFLSISRIENINRGTQENLHSYIVRHTRFLPRDVIEVGNALARAKLALSNRPSLDPKSWQKIVRAIVARSARSFGEEQLTICANQIASHERPSFSARHDYHELYTSSQEYISSRATFLKKLIVCVGKERFTLKEVDEARQYSATEISEDIDAFSALWQHGLIGCRFKSSDKGFRFFSLDDRDDFLLPDTPLEYAFHSCILDVVDVPSLSDDPIVESVIF